MPAPSRYRGLWRAKLLVAIAEGEHRFNALTAACGIPNHPATARILKRLEREGGVTRTITRVGPPTLTSRELTEHGKQLVPLARGLIEQAREHANEVCRQKGLHRIDNINTALKSAA